MSTTTQVAMIALLAANVGVVLALLARFKTWRKALHRIRAAVLARPRSGKSPVASAPVATEASGASGNDALPEALAALIRKVEIEESRDAARVSTTRQRWQDLARGGERLPGAAASCRSATAGAPGNRGSRQWHVT